jgi:trimeric autotransporter adhesin
VIATLNAISNSVPIVAGSSAAAFFIPNNQISNNPVSNDAPSNAAALNKASNQASGSGFGGFFEALAAADLGSAPPSNTEKNGGEPDRQNVNSTFNANVKAIATSHLKKSLSNAPTSLLAGSPAGIAAPPALPSPTPQTALESSVTTASATSGASEAGDTSNTSLATASTGAAQSTQSLNSRANEIVLAAASSTIAPTPSAAQTAGSSPMPTASAKTEGDRQTTNLQPPGPSMVKTFLALANDPSTTAQSTSAVPTPVSLNDPPQTLQQSAAQTFADAVPINAASIYARSISATSISAASISAASIGAALDSTSVEGVTANESAKPTAFSSITISPAGSGATNSTDDSTFASLTLAPTNAASGVTADAWIAATNSGVTASPGTTGPFAAGIPENASSEVSSPNDDASAANAPASSGLQTNVQTNSEAQTNPLNPFSPIIASATTGAQIQALSNPASIPGTPSNKAFSFGSSRAEVNAVSSARQGSQLASAFSSSTVLHPASAPANSNIATSPGSQNPFSVFFSLGSASLGAASSSSSSSGSANPAPGAESAAGVLPRMILPAASPGVLGHTISPASSNGATPSGSPQNSPAQNSMPPASKDSASTSATAPAAPSQHASSDPSTFDAQAVSSPAANPPAAAAPNSAVAATLPAAPQTPPDASPKPAPPTASPGSPAAAPTPSDAIAVAPPGPVQVAQMVNRAGESEMRIGMTTSAFGSIEVRTVVHASEVGVVIGSEKGDLHTLMANDVPSIANTLQQQNLRLNSVNFMQGFAFSNNTAGGGGGNFQQRSFAPAQPAANPMPAESVEEESVAPLPAMTYVPAAGSLSILA